MGASTGVPILAYHDVDPEFRLGSLNPTLRQFEAQMKYLRDSGYTTVSLGEIAAGLAPERAVALTFDDAYEGVRQYALPVLLRSGFRATVFVVSGFVGRRSLWDLNLRWLGGRHMGWDGVRGLARAGIEIGSHTVSHPNLVRLNASKLRVELVDSKRQLEDALGRAVDALSYPFGQYNDEIKAAALEAGYRLACGIRPRRGDPPGDVFALKRICVRSIDRMWDFRHKVRPGGPSRFQDGKEAFLAACNRTSLVARRAYDRRQAGA